MRAKRLTSLLIAACWLLGCGASKGSAQGAAPEAGSEMTPGQKCIAEASAPRTPPEDAPSSIAVSQILIRHAELKRPEGATLSREDACLKALEALEALNSSGDFDQAVQDFSDSGKATSGDLGEIKRDEVTAAFGDAAFSLDVNELSYVVESDRGFHIILRTR